MSDDLTAALNAIYDGLAPVDGARGPIHPLVGAAYGPAESGALRVMAIGINAYCEPHEAPTGDDWRRGVAGESWPFAQQLRKDLRVLTAGLAGAPALGGRPYLAPASLYLTNAVKRWLPDGKVAADVEARWFDEGAPVLQAELAALDAAGRLPHLVVVAGERAWPHVWPAFREGAAPWVARYQSQPASSPLFHFLNVVTVREAEGARPLLLLRLRHPSAVKWDKGMAPEALLAHPELRRAVGLEVAEGAGRAP